MLDQRIWCYLWYFFVALEDVDVVRLIWYKKKKKRKKRTCPSINRICIQWCRNRHSGQWDRTRQSEKCEFLIPLILVAHFRSRLSIRSSHKRSFSHLKIMRNGVSNAELVERETHGALVALVLLWWRRSRWLVGNESTWWMDGWMDACCCVFICLFCCHLNENRGSIIFYSGRQVGRATLNYSKRLKTRNGFIFMWALYRSLLALGFATRKMYDVSNCLWVSSDYYGLR